MKKYLLSLSAIAFAFLFAAFRMPSKPNSRLSMSVFFQYVGFGFSENEVEDPANWVEVSDLTSSCNNLNRAACRIKVDESVTQGFAPNRTLLSTTCIVTAEYLTTYYVLDAGDVIDARNKGFW